MKYFEKRLDLHQSEWRRHKKREPFFGPGSYWFTRVTLPTIAFAIAFAYLARFIVYGLFG